MPRTWPIGVRSLLVVIVITMAIGLLALCPCTGSSSAKSAVVVPSLVVDANSVPVQVIEALPTLGPTLARRWVAARSERPLLSLDDARRRVRGLGAATLAQITLHISFEPKVVSPSTAKSVVAAQSRPAASHADRISSEHVDRLLAARR